MRAPMSSEYVLGQCLTDRFAESATSALAGFYCALMGRTGSSRHSVLITSTCY